MSLTPYPEAWPALAVIAWREMGRILGKVYPGPGMVT